MLQDDTDYRTRQVAAGLPIKAQSLKKTKLTGVSQYSEKWLTYYEDGPARENVASVDQLYDPCVCKKLHITSWFLGLFFLSINKLISTFWEKDFIWRMFVHLLSTVMMWYNSVATAIESMK